MLNSGKSRNVLFKIIGVQLKKVYMQKIVFTGTFSPYPCSGKGGGGLSANEIITECLLHTYNYLEPTRKTLPKKYPRFSFRFYNIDSFTYFSVT